MATRALLVFPKFNPNSFWSLQAACDFYGARCVAPPLGLITMAAMLPSDWSLRLVNRNAEELEADQLEWADLVLTGGMMPQRQDTLSLIERCHAQGKPVAVGGPDVMSCPELYRAADFLVLGEAEGMIGRFLEAWQAGARCGVFEGRKFQADVTKSPVPRFDLLDFKHYLFIGVQYSRGCPFNCEFCDIIELYGRVPRTKTDAQMLGELDALHRAGYRGHVDFVDDNFIGNKKALKRFLPLLRAWQEERGYPFEFSTEASMNLADDPQLLKMMREANFFAVFTGIESPDTETLIATQKKQNTRRSLADSVHRIYEAGMLVTAGFIVGFDTEKCGMADGMIDCIEATSVPVAMVGLLTALPNTQLTRRLDGEGRLLPIDVSKGDQCTAGLNFVTLRPRRDILADYKSVLEGAYRPQAYFSRVRRLGRALNRPKYSMPPIKGWRWAFGLLGRLAWRMTVEEPGLRREFWRTMLDCALHNVRGLQYVVMMTVFYLHLGPFAEFLIGELDRRIEAEERDAAPRPLRLSA